MMNQTLIANVENKSVYLINAQNISFYISVPKVLKANIVLNLVSDVNLISTNNNMVALTGQITDLYSKFNSVDVAVVTPILDGNILEQAKLSNDEKIFVYLDKVMGFLINTSYGILKNNGIEVDNKIILNNNEIYRIFNDWFVKRYNGRVELVSYNGMASNVASVTPGTPVNRFANAPQAPVENSEASALASDVLDNTTTISSLDVASGVKPNEVREPGFVSYVLLGVIVAVVSLVMLYMLL